MKSSQHLTPLNRHSHSFDQHQPNKRTVVFAHGWALTNAFWAPLIRELTSLIGINVGFHSRRYFETSARPQPNWLPTQGEPWVGVGHSLGFRRLTELDLQDCLGLISINGFWDFSQPKGTDPRIVKRMIRGFDRQPQQVLTDFYRNCGVEQEPPATGLQLEPLRADLQQLLVENQRSFPVSRCSQVPVVGLAGANDKIVPLAQSKAQFETLCVHSHAHHSLGLEHASWCAARIDETLKAWTS